MRHVSIAIASLLRFENYEATIEKEFGRLPGLADVVRAVAAEYAQTFPTIATNANAWLAKHPQEPP